MELVLDTVALPRLRYRGRWGWRQKYDGLRGKFDGFILRMSGSASNYAAKKRLEELLGGVAYVSAAHVYLALCTTLPDDTSTGSTIVETDYTSYVRTEIGTGNNQTDAWNAATGTTTAVVTNKNAISCPAATGASTNPLVGVAVVDASSGGNVLFWASITSTPIVSGDTPKINASALSITDD